jgi:hypothetical protein
MRQAKAYSPSRNTFTRWWVLLQVKAAIVCFILIKNISQPCQTGTVASVPAFC